MQTPGSYSGYPKSYGAYPAYPHYSNYGAAYAGGYGQSSYPQRQWNSAYPHAAYPSSASRPAAYPHAPSSQHHHPQQQQQHTWKSAEYEGKKEVRSVATPPSAASPDIETIDLSDDEPMPPPKPSARKPTKAPSPAKSSASSAKSTLSARHGPMPEPMEETFRWAQLIESEEGSAGDSASEEEEPEDAPPPVPATKPTPAPIPPDSDAPKRSASKAPEAPPAKKPRIQPPPVAKELKNLKTYYNRQPEHAATTKKVASKLPQAAKKSPSVAIPPAPIPKAKPSEDPAHKVGSTAGRFLSKMKELSRSRASAEPPSHHMSSARLDAVMATAAPAPPKPKPQVTPTPITTKSVKRVRKESTVLLAAPKPSPIVKAQGGREVKVPPVDTKGQVVTMKPKVVAVQTKPKVEAVHMKPKVEAAQLKSKVEAVKVSNTQNSTIGGISRVPSRQHVKSLRRPLFLSKHNGGKTNKPSGKPAALFSKKGIVQQLIRRRTQGNDTDHAKPAETATSSAPKTTEPTETLAPKAPDAVEEKLSATLSEAPTEAPLFDIVEDDPVPVTNEPNAKSAEVSTVIAGRGGISEMDKEELHHVAPEPEIVHQPSPLPKCASPPKPAFIKPRYVSPAKIPSRKDSPAKAAQSAVKSVVDDAAPKATASEPVLESASSTAVEVPAPSSEQHRADESGADESGAEDERQPGQCVICPSTSQERYLDFGAQYEHSLGHKASGGGKGADSKWMNEAFPNGVPSTPKPKPKTPSPKKTPEPKTPPAAELAKEQPLLKSILHSIASGDDANLDSLRASKPLPCTPPRAPIQRSSDPSMKGLFMPKALRMQQERMERSTQLRKLDFSQKPTPLSTLASSLEERKKQMVREISKTTAKSSNPHRPGLSKYSGWDSLVGGLRAGRPGAASSATITVTRTVTTNPAKPSTSDPDLVRLRNSYAFRLEKSAAKYTSSLICRHPDRKGSSCGRRLWGQKSPKEAIQSHIKEVHLISYHFTCLQCARTACSRSAHLRNYHNFQKKVPEEILKSGVMFESSEQVFIKDLMTTLELSFPMGATVERGAVPETPRSKAACPSRGPILFGPTPLKPTAPAPRLVDKGWYTVQKPAGPSYLGSVVTQRPRILPRPPLPPPPAPPTSTLKIVELGTHPPDPVVTPVEATPFKVPQPLRTASAGFQTPTKTPAAQPSVELSSEQMEQLLAKLTHRTETLDTVPDKPTSPRTDATPSPVRIDGVQICTVCNETFPNLDSADRHPCNSAIL